MYECSCGEEEKRNYTDKLPHTNVNDAEIPATCIATGTTAGTHCSKCGVTTSGKETIPMTEHTYKKGEMYDTCTYCGKLIGIYGSGLNWSLDHKGLLAISGTGSMNISGPYPWSAFNEKIVDVTMDAGLANIGEKAFAGTGITSAEIPNSVTSIGAGAFENCVQLNELVLPSAVTKIADSTFAGCTELRKITFRGCTGSSGVTFPDSVTSIGKYAFSGCKGLTTVSLPQGAVSIGKYAFQDCTGLQEIKIPSDSITVSDYAFAGSGLQKVTLGDGVKHIDEYAFADCEKLEEIAPLNGLTSIGPGAFQNCKALHNFAIPHSVTDVGRYAFAGAGLQTITLSNRLKKIAHNTFENCTELKAIKITDKITEIEQDAFAGCTALAEIEIPDTVEKIGQRAFKNCTGLTKITVPENSNRKENLHIGNETFFGCTSLTELTIPTDCYVSLGDLIFANCTGLQKLVIPQSVGSVGKEAFANCTALKKVTFEGEPPSRIGENVFKGVTATVHYNAEANGWDRVTSRDHGGTITWDREHNYTTEVVPGTCEDGYTLHSCECGNSYKDSSTAGSHTIENGICTVCKVYGTCGENLTWRRKSFTVTVSGSGPMHDSKTAWPSGITEVILEDGITRIGDNAFRELEFLGIVSMTDSVTSIGKRAFMECEELFDIKLSNNITIIPEEAFRDCVYIKEIKIPAKATEIGRYAFRNCKKLNTIYLPISLTEVHEEAFFECASIGDVYYEGTEEQWKALPCASYECFKNATIHYNEYDKVCTEHIWDSGEVTKEATEEAEGEKIVTCTVCGETETRVIPKKEHTHNYHKDTVTPPTCVDEGYTTYKCDCGDEKTEDRKPAEGHKWNEGEVTKEPTEETEGEKIVTCDVCGETETRVIPKLEIPTEGTQKTPGEAWEYDNDGTGKNDDLTSAEAVTLDQTYRGRVGKAGDLADCYQIPASGAELKFTVTLWSTTMHILEDRGLEIQFYDAEGQLVTPDKSNVLTRDLEGVLLYDFLHTYQFAAGSPVAYAKFSVKNAEKGNGYSFKAEVTGEAPHVHSYREEVTPSTCDKEGCITYTCDCGDKKTEVIPMKDHEWDDGEVTKEATEEAEGEKTFTCTVCGGTKTEVIPKLEHVHSFGEAWQSDEAGHWQQCACGVKDGEGAHADADRNGSCEICGYKMEVISGDSIASGTCGENLTWNLAKSGVLTISGTGSMPPYIAPWSEHADQITKVILEDGISNVGAEAFKNCRNLAEAILPDSVTIIAHGAFSGCGKLETVNLPDHLTKLVGEAFAGCSALKEVTIPASITDIGYSAFRNCTALQQITFQGSAPKIGNGAFQGVTAQVAFPEEDTTWNDATKQSYGGTLTWGDEHEHSYTETVTPPTCEEQGFTTYTCSCGHSYEGDYTDPLPHEYEFEDAENTRGTCIHCGTATFVDFTSFDELKELAKLDDSEINLYYKGTGPLTIEEDLILDNWISLYAEDLVISEGAILTVEDGFTAIHADNLTVNGVLVNDGMIFVSDTLTVNGKVQQNLLLIMEDPIHSTATGTENIQPGTLFEDAGLGILAERPLIWYCIYTNQTELESLVAQANASTDSRSMYLFEYGGEEGSVFHLTRSVELGEASVFDMKQSFVIDPGVTLTSQGAIYVDEGTATIKGILNNEGYLEINHSSGAALNFSDGGTYTGSGELRVYTNEETYPEAVITGIDMSDFRIEEKTETSGEETTRYFKLTYEASEDPVPPVAAAVTRISGTNRIKTAIASADKLKEVLGVEKFNTIVVANAMDFPDALSGSYLAAVAKAPILLYADGQALVTEYIKNNLAPGGIVYILGGEKSVSNEIITKLPGIPCARVAGSGRFATSLAIIRKADEIRGSKPDKVLICHALAFADSLSASATGLPILLVNGAGSLNVDQKAYLESVRGAELYVIGGKNSVSEDILTALNAYDANGAERVYGSGRELTSVAVAEKFFPEAKAAALASSLSFPDGLSGGPVAYAMNMPLLLTRETKESIAESYVNTNGITEGYVIGGTDAVADVTARAVFGESAVIK